MRRTAPSLSQRTRSGQLLKPRDVSKVAQKFQSRRRKQAVNMTEELKCSKKVDRRGQFNWLKAHVEDQVAV